MADSGLLVAGVDVGGTNIEVGLVDQQHKVHARKKAPTPTEGPDAVLSAIADLVKAIDGDPIAAGVGIPGVVHEGRVLTVPIWGTGTSRSTWLTTSVTDSASR